MFGSRSTQPAGRTAWQYLSTGARVAALTAYGLLAAAGTVVTPGPSLVLGTLLAVAAGAVVAGLHRVPDLAPLPHPAVAAARVLFFPAAIAGCSVLGAPGTLVGLAGMIAATGYVALWANLPTSEPPGDPLHAAVPPTEGSLRELLGALPTDALLDEWRDAREHDDPCSPAGANGVRLRELLIDEMQRRDPSGTSRWLAVGFDEPPDGYVGRRTA